LIRRLQSLSRGDHPPLERRIRRRGTSRRPTSTHPLTDSPRVTIDGHEWFAGDARNPFRIIE
jgi:hypothetical protein